MKNLLLRSVSGIVYVGIIVAGLIAGQWAFAGMCAVFTILAVVEFGKLCHAGKGETCRALMLLDVLGGLAMVGAAFLYFSGTVELPLGLIAVPYVLYLIARPVAQLYMRKAPALEGLACSLMGQIYVALPMAMMNVLYFDLATPHLLLAMFIMIWLNDTGAFVVGSAMGRHRLFPRVSPKKSWEGFLGGMVFSVGSAFLFHEVFPGFFAGAGLWTLVGLGAVVSVFATWGDLVESLIKRTVGVKDSGNLIPGHGGILDRIDSLLLVIPAMVCYFILTGCLAG